MATDAAPITRIGTEEGISMPDLIRTRRIELGMSQGDLAKRLNVGQQTISRWESGDAVPRPRTVRSLAQALGLVAGELLHLSGYLTADEVGGAGTHDAVKYDRISTKLSQLSERDRETVEHLIDTMLRQRA